MKVKTPSKSITGEISMAGQMARIVVGLAIILFSLFQAVNTGTPMIVEFFVGTLITLLGIAAWDPIVAMARRVKVFAAETTLYISQKTRHA